MEESVLIKIAIVFSLAGLILLFLVSREIELNDTTIRKITNEKIEGTVSVTGIIKEMKNTDKATIIVVEEVSEITAVAFQPDLELRIGDKVNIIGRVSGQEIMIDSVTLET